MTSQAQIGRDAVQAITNVTARKHGFNHYVNKTEKYVSIKIERVHLSEPQLDEVAEILHKQHPDRFLAVYNATAHPSSRGMSWTEDKINVRFTQA